MTVLRLSNISITYQGNPVLRDVSAVLSPGDRIGIVGPNGSGKTTLLRLILGEIMPDTGTVDWVKRPRIGYVPQTFRDDESMTPLDLIGHDKAEYLGQCGIGKSLWDRPAGNMSGGEKTRLSLAIALSERPEILILDEPTNHLDIPGIEWLEKLLSLYRGSVMVVSHDRSFLDAVAKKIWEVRETRLRVYQGNYSAYMRELTARLAHERREYAKWSREIQGLKEEIRARRQWYEKAHKDAGQNDFLRRKAKKHARQFQAKESELARLMARKPEVTKDDLPVIAGISHAGIRTETLARAERLCFAYLDPGQAGPALPSPFAAGKNRAGRTVIDNASFHIGPGQKIGLIGRNGSGKTTLLRLIAGELAPGSGSLWVNPGAKVGYLAQVLEDLDPERSAAENVSIKTGLPLPPSRDLLGRLGVSGDKQMRPLGTLSMGERTRVAVACLCFGAFDLLLLDEPTNHLDVQAREAVEEALGSYRGTLVVATHDRYLLDRVSNTIWHLDSGRLTIHQGTYGDFRRRLSDNLPAEVKDRSAEELALKAELAYVVSLISAAKDEAEKADLDRRYGEILAKLKDLRKGK
ncbi:MAG TPA: ABC-F family ATP-binding cassette domain-containing protein [Firmicutes bacterium]|nr:ABC-F family ATP-binding cassette domain-containing protein [Candidatus Fermentithermobacillaceae bacterium]